MCLHWTEITCKDNIDRLDYVKEMHVETFNESEFYSRQGNKDLSFLKPPESHLGPVGFVSIVYWSVFLQK
jgi:hypothetical protein